METSLLNLGFFQHTCPFSIKGSIAICAVKSPANVLLVLCKTIFAPVVKSAVAIFISQLRYGCYAIDHINRHAS